MALLLRCATLAAVALALTPSTSLALDVEAIEASGEEGIPDTILITDEEGLPDDVTVTETADSFVIHREDGEPFNDSPSNASGQFCSGGDPRDGSPSSLPVTCPRVPTISVNLASGQESDRDTFTPVNVTVPVSVSGGAGDDVLIGGSAGDVLAGGPGTDRLNGGGGIDEYFGEAGDDIIDAFDSLAERISCGGGPNDQVRNDPIDVILECERGQDIDRDNFATTTDCNDANAAIFPGAREIFDNGIDEDCDGRDNVNLDRDGDGFARPTDCDDGNAAVRLNVVEVRGNNTDENCDGRVEPFADLTAALSNRWTVTARYTRLAALLVRSAAAGTRVTLSCSGRGCPLRRALQFTVERDLAPLNIRRRLARSRLRAGARVRVTMTADGTIGRTYSFRILAGKEPTKTTRCRAPGESGSRPC